MRNSTSKSTPTPLPTTVHQQAILKEVGRLFHDADPAEYIEHINALIGLGLQHVGDPDYIGTVAYHTTKVVSFLARLGDLTRYQREELLRGGMTEEQVYWNS